MKSNIRPTVYFSMHASTGLPATISRRSSQPTSPYLRAILSGKGNSARVSQFKDDDRLAAIRYIKETQVRKK